MRTLFRAIVGALSVLTTAAATAWSLSDATLAVGPKGKDATSSYTFTKSFGIEEVIELSPADTLRLAFTATLDDKASRPHQSFILIKDPSSPLEVVVPVPVKPSGKAKIDIDHRDIPPQLLYVDTLQVSLVVASFGDSTPLKVGIATVRPVTNEASPTRPEEPERWLPKPEITHTFRGPQKLPNKQLSLLLSGAVAAGLPLFFVLLMFAPADLNSWGKAMADAPLAHAMFFASLVIFEIRFFKYWLSGTLGQILIESGAIGIVGFLSGRSALGEVMRRRAGKS